MARKRSSTGNKSQKNHTLLRTIGLILVFPIPITIWAFRQNGKGWNLLVKLLVSLAAWGVYLAIGLLNAPAKDTQGTGEKPSTSVSNVTESTQESQETEAPETETQGDHYNPNLQGRGRSDGARTEPDYINVIGYAVVSASQEFDIERTEDFQNPDLWVIPTYEQDKQFWVETGITIPHKTEVVVRKQLLKHEGYGLYSGYLLVEKLDDGSQFYIDVYNYATKPYWLYQDNLRDAANGGTLIAEYNQVSDYYPVTGKDKVEIPDGTIVLITGTKGTSSSGTDIEAVVWKEWRYGYGGVKCVFNAKDLTILY